MKISRGIQWLRVLSSEPKEFRERLASAIENRREKTDFAGRDVYHPVEWGEALASLQSAISNPFPAPDSDPGLSDISAAVRQRQLSHRDNPPWPMTTDGGDMLAKTCYLLVRALKPEIVVETGVAYGVTSAYILKALELNGVGTLYSVDLPPLRKNTDDFVGALIPEGLRENWKLHRGSSRQVLPGLLKQLGNVDMFIHDSLHTYPTMKWEFETVEPYLAKESIVVADDIQTNAAFKEWSSRSPIHTSLAIDEPSKQSIFGVANVRR